MQYNQPIIVIPRLVRGTHVRFLACILITLSLLASPLKTLAADTSPQNAYFLSLADIHFDPYLSCKGGHACPLIDLLRAAPATEWPAILAANTPTQPMRRQDTNYVLLHSAFMTAGSVAEQHHARFVIVLGDFLGHDYRRKFKKYANNPALGDYSAFVRKTLLFISYELNQAFPKTDVYTVVGNNDSYQGDYVVKPNGAFFSDTATIWSTLIKTPANRNVMRTEFTHAGYYALNVQPNLRLIVLDTSLFSSKARGKGVHEAAERELEWFHAQLKSAYDKQQRVFIALHIPPNVNAATALRFPILSFMKFWQDDYVEHFQDNLNQYASIITGIFSGHLHVDWYQTLTLNKLYKIKMIGTPSISPIYGTDPGFTLNEYNITSGQMIGFDNYFYQIDTSKIWLAKQMINPALLQAQG